MGLWGRVYLGMCARGVGEGVFLDEGRRGFGIPGGGVVGEISAGQTGKGLVGRAEGEVVGGPLLARVFGKHIRCSADMWQDFTEGRGEDPINAVHAYEPVSVRLV